MSAQFKKGMERAAGATPWQLLLSLDNNSDGKRGGWSGCSVCLGALTNVDNGLTGGCLAAK